MSVADVSALCLTHLDHDHFNRNWLGTILARGVRPSSATSTGWTTSPHRPRNAPRPRTARAVSALVQPFNGEPFEPLPGLEVRPILLAHDRLGSSGFVLSGFDHRVGFATDLGRVPEALFEEFCDLDVLAIESNYDHRMQVDSPRPWFLKQRIMGGSGHLSNQQAFDTVRTIFNRCEATGARLPRRTLSCCTAAASATAPTASQAVRARRADRAAPGAGRAARAHRVARRGPAGSTR